MGSYHVSCRLFLSVLSFLVCFKVSSGMVCEREHNRFAHFFMKTVECPQFGDFDNAYCCENSDGSFYCCDFDDFAKSKGAQFILPVVIGVAIGVLAGCFLCCLCCPCCMLYKRRHQGTVYGRVQQPAVTVSVQTPGQTTGFVPSPVPLPMPQPIQQPISQPGGFVQPSVMPYPPYPTVSVDHSGQSQVPPPPYSAAVANEVYAKQSPYNPNFYGN